jgi:hypothetical protein
MSESDFPIRFVDEFSQRTAVADVYAMVAIVDTASPTGHAAIRRIIGPTAEEVLAPHPSQFVIYVLYSDFTAWVRNCATEDLVIFEAMKILRDAHLFAPLKIHMTLLLTPDFRQRVILTLTSRHVQPSGTA